MRGPRWLLLLAIAAIIGGIVFTYRAQKRSAAAHALAVPKELPDDLHARAELWHWVETDAKTGHVRADITAEDFREVKDSSRVDLKGMKLRLPGKKNDTYDLVEGANAQFYKSEHRLFSEGEVKITLNLPMTGAPQRAPVIVHSAGVTFNTESYRAETDSPSTFTFQNGSGKATGAYYDPGAHELRMKQDVEIHYRAQGPDAKPMTIEAGGLVFHENDQTIELPPWGKLTREGTVVEGDAPLIRLQNHEIHNVHAFHARGTEDNDNRQIAYSASELFMDCNDRGQVEHIGAQNDARLVSNAPTSQTTVTGDRVDLFFEVRDNRSILLRVAAAGHGVVTSKPLPAPGSDPGDTHVLSSDKLEMTMRPGGKELDRVITHGLSSLEFVPNAAANHHRVLRGNDFLIGYGKDNRIDTFHATDAHTATDPNAEERKRKRAQSVTSSREINARFDPKTSHLAAMEQSGGFVYTEGDRQARAAKATLDSDQNVMVLEGAARMWDATGATSADRIRMDQRSGDFTAEGSVNSSRMPEQDAKKNSQMLATDEPLQAQARRMVSKDKSRNLHYEGGVVMWQGANRITAETVDVDREKRSLIADRNVVSSLWEEPKDEEKKKTAVPVLTVMRAPRLVYTDADRLAVYSGGVDMSRPGMHITSRELHAFLADSSADSRLEKAFADGGVKIVATTVNGVRTATAEHSEYYTDDAKVILTGGRPRLVDDGGHSTEGEKLTYYSNDDRLTVDGASSRPVQSFITRHRK
ncbi:MAG: LPS export ABC transporter periplasmic protein LptC [Bryobacteraceae bacterium]|jgi:lipopolysaccharide export system protein LptA